MMVYKGFTQDEVVNFRSKQNDKLIKQAKSRQRKADLQEWLAWLETLQSTSNVYTVKQTFINAKIKEIKKELK